jgi:hypothetical protein
LAIGKMMGGGMSIMQTIKQPTAVEQYEQADRLLAEAVRARVQLSQPDREWMAATLGWDRSKIDSQLGRMKRVCRLQQIAGCEADRAQLAAAVDSCAVALATRGPVLAKEIQERQRELRALEAAARLAKRRLDHSQAALERLGQLLPDHLLGRVAEAEDIGQEIERCRRHYWR